MASVALFNDATILIMGCLFQIDVCCTEVECIFSFGSNRLNSMSCIIVNHRKH